jgi:hypothetical protein
VFEFGWIQSRDESTAVASQPFCVPFRVPSTSLLDTCV